MAPPSSKTALRLLLFTLILTSQGLQARRAFTPPKYPWHLVNLWWTSGSSTPSFSELAIDFEIVGEVAEGVDLYIAPLGLVKIGPVPAYGGIQTSMRGWPGKKERRMAPIGRGGIFSRWSVDGEPLSLDEAIGSAGTHYEAGGYEGEFVSVRHHVAWTEGRYTYFLRRWKGSSRELWFKASVREQATGKEVEIGFLRFDVSDRSLGAQIASFVEVYGSTSVIPELTILFSEPRVDGSKRPATKLTITYPDNGSDSTMRFAEASRSGERVVVTLVPAGLKNSPKR